MEKVQNFRPASIKRRSPCRRVVYTLLVSTQILHMPGSTLPFAVESGKMDDADIKVTTAKFKFAQRQQMKSSMNDVWNI